MSSPSCRLLRTASRIVFGAVLIAGVSSIPVLTGCRGLRTPTTEELRARATEKFDEGTKYEDRREFARAIGLYQESLSLATRPVVLCRLGHCYAETKDLAHAQYYLEQALRVQPDYRLALLELERVKFLREKAGEAPAQTSEKTTSLPASSVRQPKRLSASDTDKPVFLVDDGTAMPARTVEGQVPSARPDPPFLAKTGRPAAQFADASVKPQEKSLSPKPVLERVTAPEASEETASPAPPAPAAPEKPAAVEIASAMPPSSSVIRPKISRPAPPSPTPRSASAPKPAPVAGPTPAPRPAARIVALPEVEIPRTPTPEEKAQSTLRMEDFLTTEETASRAEPSGRPAQKPQPETRASRTGPAVAPESVSTPATEIENPPEWVATPMPPTARAATAAVAAAEVVAKPRPTSVPKPTPRPRPTPTSRPAPRPEPTLAPEPEPSPRPTPTPPPPSYAEVHGTLFPDRDRAGAPSRERRRTDSEEERGPSPRAASESGIMLDTFAYHHQNGKSLMEVKEYEKALEEFDKALAIDPVNLDGLLSIGDALAKLGRTQAALERYRKAEEMYPRQARVQLKIGNLFINDKRPEAQETARKAFERATRTDPNYYRAFNNLGIVEMNLGHYDAAIAAFKKVLEIDKDYANAHLNLGILYQDHKGNKLDAFYHYRRYIELGGERAAEVEQWMSALN